MHIVALQRCMAFHPGFQAAHCSLLPVGRATQTCRPLQVLRVDGSFVQRIRVRPAFAESSSQRVSASSSQETSRRTSWKRVADQTLPVTPEAVLLALPVLIVAIPWAVSHLQLCLALGAVIALSPFGTVIWSLVPPSLGRLSEQQQQHRRQRHGRGSQVSWQSMQQAQSFWPVERRLLREPPLIIEPDVLGPSSDVPQNRGNSSHRPSAVLQRPQGFRQSSTRPARDSISISPRMLPRQAPRRHRRVGRDQVAGQAVMYDQTDSTTATLGRAMQAGNRVQQVAQDFVAPFPPTASDFWEDKPLGKAGERQMAARILRRVPFLGSWGGLL